MIFLYKFAIRQHFFVPKRITAQLENILESKMKNLFRDWIKNDKSHQFYIQHLLFSENFDQTKYFHRYKTLLVILKTRGLLRTLLFLIALPNNDDTSDIHLSKRMDIIKFLISRRVNFFKHVVAKLKIVYPKPNDLDDSPHIKDLVKFNLTVLSPHQGKEIIYFNIQNEAPPIFGNDDRRKIPKEEVFFHKLLLWDPQSVVDFILKKKMQEISKHYLDEVYPQATSELFGFLNVHLKVLPRYDKVLGADLTGQFQSRYQKLQSVQIWHQRFIISNTEFLIHDSTCHPEQEFVAGQMQFIKLFDKKKNSCLLKKALGETRNLESGIFLSGRCDENWYHFIIDTVPRMLYVEDIPVNVPLLIRSDIPENSKMVLASITDREIIEIDPSEVIELQNLYVVPARSSAFDSKPPKGTPIVDFSPQALKSCRNLLLNAQTGVVDNSGVESGDLSIALTRSSTTRNIQNSWSVNILLKEFDFTVYELNLNFFKDQIKTFSWAKIVVAAGGAALANIIFMPQGSKVVVMRSYRNRKLNLWVKLAEATGVDCIEVTGMPTYFGPGKLRRQHSDFYISPRKLRKVLASVTASTTR